MVYKVYNKLMRLFNNRYQFKISRRNLSSEPEEPDINLFDQKAYQEINSARLTHLDSLHLDIDRRTVLDVGSGQGDLSQYFVHKGCNVVCIDARSKNIEQLKLKYPHLTAHVADVESSPLNKYGVFDFVFCYGLLYHLENPIAALRNIKSACKNILLLETMICDHQKPIATLVDERLSPTQAIKGLGIRPSPSFVALALNRIGFHFVYITRKVPDHPQFNFKWENNLDWERDGHPLRLIFVASTTKLANAQLIELFLE